MSQANFYLKKMNFGMTYSKLPLMDKQIFHDALLKKIDDKGQRANLSYLCTAREKHDETLDDYDPERPIHFHVFARFKHDVTIRDARWWDVNIDGANYHPKIEPRIRGFNNWNKYIQKDGDFLVEGEFDPVLSEQAAKGRKAYAAQRVLAAGAITEEIMGAHPELLYDFDKLSRNLALYNRKRAAESVVVDMSNPYPWQDKAIRVADGPIHPRRIHWVVDPQGNLGKSHLGRYWSAHKKGFLAGKRKHDVHHAYAGQRIVFWDLTRQDDTSEGEGRFIYSLIEEIKNGHFFSGKYDSSSCLWPSPHVFVFSNWEPDTTQLSADRWDIWHLNPETKDVDGVPRAIAYLDAQVAQRTAPTQTAPVIDLTQDDMDVQPPQGAAEENGEESDDELFLPLDLDVYDYQDYDLEEDPIEEFTQTDVGVADQLSQDLEIADELASLA